ncbi:MAG: hypothetical protein EOP83_25205, partial [Verrucomicrobiaceae bacterium]
MADPTPDEYLLVSKQFDYEVATRATMYANAGAGRYVIGDRIMVTHDEQADGFWTLWAYRPRADAANDQGFVFEAAQTYRTSDFWSAVDWYATGYSSKVPPRVSYPNTQARDLYEYPTPKNTFVRIDSDDTTGWSWTAYDAVEGGWKVVAREKGTVKLSERFYDESRTVYSANQTSVGELTSIPTRDGAWELREMFNALRFNILTNAQLNELFFSMLNFYHAQQDQVDWAFKTSFMSVLGYNEKLDQSPVQTYDNTENLITYLNEVKPYRVKVRDF